MNRQTVHLVLSLILWSPILPLAWVISFSSGINYYFTYSLLPIYLIAIPLGAVRFVERQRIIERFGMQPSRCLVLILLVITSIVGILTMTTAGWSAFLGVLLAPIPEEVFFRGYIQGKFTNVNTLESLGVVIGHLVFSSAIFSLSHIFANYTFGAHVWAFLLGFVMGSVYLVSGSILLPVVVHTAVNFLLSVKVEYLPSTQLWLWLAFSIIPSCLLFVIEYSVGKRKARATVPVA